jgi:hypothetical protein
MLKGRITDRHALIENPLFTTITPRSSTKTPKMGRNETVASFGLSFPKFGFLSYRNHIALEHINFGESLGVRKVQEIKALMMPIHR